MYTSTISDQTDRTGTLVCYDGAGLLAGIPSRNNIVAEFDNGITTIFQQSLSGKQPIHFMPTDGSIRPFFNVEVPENHSLSSLKTILTCILSVTLKNTTKFGFEDIRAFPLQGYYTEKKAYIRIRTWNHFDRWAVLSNYLYEFTPDGTYLFRLSVDNYNPISEDDYNNPLFSSALTRDRTLILTWNIETYSSRKTGEMPNAKYDEDRVFMICMTVHWKDDPEPLKQICLVDVETAPEPSWITIVCGSQTDLLKAFALCWKLLAPDIHIGFNDSQYDWWFIIEKANKLGVLEWMFNHMSFKPSSLEKIIKWEYRYNMIKVNDRKFHSKHLKIPGCVAIDVRPCFMGIYSKAEKSSLAFYLNECELESKMDMPIHRMNKYYERALKKPDCMSAEQMREVAKYCIIDALSCQRLMVKHNAINEYREVASIAFLSLFDAHYFAGETGKYPGAYVFTPVKGLENRRPVTGLDFASLYLNLIITYNLSPDKIILSQEHAVSVEQSDKKLHKIEFLFNNNPQRAWSVQHNNISEEKGLYTSVLEYLSGKRNEMKKRLAPLKEKKEDMDLVISSMGKSLSLSEAIEQILANAEVEKRNGLTKNLYHFIHKEKHEFIAEYDSICFDCSCLNKKQYAFKVYMNTFYGTAGDNFVKRKGFEIKYGDTNSLYLVCPEERFQRCDEAYDSGNGISKEEYWSRMVEISMVEMEKLRDEVNDFLKDPLILKWHMRKSYFRHTREEADAKRLIKRGLTSEPYLYEIPEPGERFEYVVVENDSSDKVGNKMEYPEALKKLKDANKAGDNKADDGGVDGYDLDEDEEDEDKMDEDEVSKIRDALAQKSAEKWIRGARIYAKKIFDTTYADKGEHLTNNAYYQSFLNALDKQEESIRLKLSSLLKEISKVDIEYRDSMYKLVTKKRAMSLEQYLISYYLDDDKKDDSSEADIDEIIELYG
ncbi:ribonuclease H-like domain-containing protein [Rhizophagus irregularis DAOM 181602=DAOM 197198]|nr:ribonuclease H-like domain-containing protein [Rhizophagus irregularis DAOM 181602=DAOM 197198]